MERINTCQFVSLDDARQVLVGCLGDVLAGLDELDFVDRFLTQLPLRASWEQPVMEMIESFGKASVSWQPTGTSYQVDIEGTLQGVQFDELVVTASDGRTVTVPWEQRHSVLLGLPIPA